MGSSLTFKVAGAQPAAAATAWARVAAEMGAADVALSRFRADSPLSQLNAVAGTGQWRFAEPRLRRLLALAHRAQRATRGLFDARTLEVLEELGERAGVSFARAASPPAFGEGGWLRRDGRSRVAVSSPIDSGGLGKGLGLRWALAAARRAAPNAAGLLIEAGGDIVAHGALASGAPWHIGIEDPADPAQLLAVVALSSGALATSSTSLRAWTTRSGMAAHHLIDPRTWLPAESGLLAVSVAHSDPAWAEIWSKALFVGGAGTIGHEARSRGLAVWWVEADGRLHRTPAAATSTTWQA
ncbi:MAG TPA: FAD:protein FMN transferase [Candidatus Limnocylindria bacterium]|jgi:thiamine biosynthesis lipoprotein|nr:FAD:protein FMN transferase [Candidatus Limnocylindria bacterium]